MQEKIDRLIDEIRKIHDLVPPDKLTDAITVELNILAVTAKVFREYCEVLEKLQTRPMQAESKWELGFRTMWIRVMGEKTPMSGTVAEATRKMLEQVETDQEIVAP